MKSDRHDVRTSLLVMAGLAACGFYFGLSPIFLRLGAVSMAAAVALTGALALGRWGDGRAAT